VFIGSREVHPEPNQRRKPAPAIDYRHSPDAEPVILLRLSAYPVLACGPCQRESPHSTGTGCVRRIWVLLPSPVHGACAAQRCRPAVDGGWAVLRLAEALGVPAERLAEGVDDPAGDEAEAPEATPQRPRERRTS